MDYTSAKLPFKIRKAVRYVRLYGPNRTLIKIQGQYHSKNFQRFTFEGQRWINAACTSPDSSARKVAVIGCGNYAFSNICYYLAKEQSTFLRAAYDRNSGKAVSLCKKFGGAYATADWRDIVTDPAVGLVYIASNHASHAEYAIPLILAGKHVHIEKPHVTSFEQLSRLTEAMATNPQSKVFLGFNRPRSQLFKRLKGVLDTETGPLMVNWFVAGHELDENHWYFNSGEGGRVLGNICHWTDITLHLTSLRQGFPCTIVPTSLKDARSDFIVSTLFADRSSASITFSAKGHAFEGVREILNVHKGNVLATLSEFQTLAVDKMEKKFKWSLLFRDHGHRANILNSYKMSFGKGAGEAPSYIVNTARFFLSVREAVEHGRPIELEWDDSLKEGSGMVDIAPSGEIGVCLAN